MYKIFTHTFSTTICNIIAHLLKKLICKVILNTGQHFVVKQCIPFYYFITLFEEKSEFERMKILPC